MSIEKLQAVGLFVFILRDEPEAEKMGLILPDQAKKKPNTGEIISVGSTVSDKKISKGKKAIFNQQAGFIIEIFGKEITVLNEAQVLGVC